MRRRHISASPVRLGAAFLVCLVAAACGGENSPPLTPSEPTFQFRPGPSVLSVAATSDSGCNGTNALWLLPSLGASLATRVMAERSGADWTVRAASPVDGDLEVRFRADPGSAPDTPFTGTIRGSGAHYFDLLSPRPLPAARVMFAGSGPDTAAVLEGTLFQSLGVFGTVKGAITFTDGAGVSVTCSQAGLLIDPQR